MGQTCTQVLHSRHSCVSTMARSFTNLIAVRGHKSTQPPQPTHFSLSILIMFEPPEYTLTHPITIHFPVFIYYSLFRIKGLQLSIKYLAANLLWNFDLYPLSTQIVKLFRGNWALPSVIIYFKTFMNMNSNSKYYHLKPESIKNYLAVPLKLRIPNLFYKK